MTRSSNPCPLSPLARVFRPPPPPPRLDLMAPPALDSTALGGGIVLVGTDTC